MAVSDQRAKAANIGCFVVAIAVFVGTVYAAWRIDFVGSALSIVGGVIVGYWVIYSIAYSIACFGTWAVQQQNQSLECMRRKDSDGPVVKREYDHTERNRSGPRYRDRCGNIAEGIPTGARVSPGTVRIKCICDGNEHMLLLENTTNAAVTADVRLDNSVLGVQAAYRFDFKTVVEVKNGTLSIPLGPCGSAILIPTAAVAASQDIQHNLQVLSALMRGKGR